MSLFLGLCLALCFCSASLSLLLQPSVLPSAAAISRLCALTCALSLGLLLGAAAERTGVANGRNEQSGHDPMGRNGAISALSPGVAGVSARLVAGHPEHGRAHALLALHSHWEWRPVVNRLLQPFSYVDEAMLEAGVASCHENGTMYCMRMQIVNGQLFLTDYRAIFFDRQYAPSRVLPLLETLRRHPDLPDVDLVVAPNDEPRIKTVVHSKYWTRTCQQYPGRHSTPEHRRSAPVQLPPPLFSSTINRAHLDLPWPEFSFFMPNKPHKLRTPPWSVIQPQMIEQSSRVLWEEKLPLAMHTGNVGSPFRKRLAAVAEEHPESMFVNELFIGDHRKIKQTCKELGLHDKGGYQKHKCFMRFAEQCSYKYLVNSASIGFANKFKYLLLCGSVVIYVEDGMAHQEFYELGLLPGVHYISVATAADVPAVVDQLRANDTYARAVAEAGRARIMALDTAAVTDFLAELLRGYAKLLRMKVKPQPGAVRINCEDDLWRHYARDVWFLNQFKTEDNSTCVRPIVPGTPLRPPGWGGAYAGSKPRCTASHDLRPIAQPTACDSYQRWLGGESFEPFGVFPKPHPDDKVDWMAQ